jgi:long-subunit fatty acid transport protein
MPLIFDWKDSLIAKIGIEYQVNQRLAVRAGYCFVESPVPDHTLSPGNPEAHQHNASLGLGFKGTRWWADVFYNAAFYQDRTVSNEILRGKYQSFCHYSGISLGYRF